MSFSLQQAIAEAKPGGVVTVPPGTYAVNLFIDKPLSIVGLGEVIFDGQRSGSVLRVNTQGTVKLGGLMIVGGRTNAMGGGVCLEGGELELAQCTLRFNEAPVHGGGGLGVRAGHAKVTACRFEANTGRQGGAVLVDGDGQLTMRDCLLAQNAGFDGGGLRVKESGVATLLGCTLADNKVLGEHPTGSAVSLSGSTTRTSSLTMTQCLVAERSQGPECLHNFAGARGTLILRKNLLPPWCSSFAGDNRFGPPGFVGTGLEPYLLTSQSSAVGTGELELYGPGAKDVLGRPRNSGDLGAFTFR